MTSSASPTTTAANKPAPASACDPREWLEHYAAALDWTRRLFDDAEVRRSLDAYAATLGVDAQSAELALRKTVAAVMDADAEARVGAASNEAVPAQGLPWTSRVSPGAWRDGSGGSRLRLAAYWLWLLGRVLAPRFSSSPRPKAAILFDQYYDHLDDQEFLAFYRYFKTREDVAYSCPTGTGSKFRFLAEGGKPVLADRWGVPFARKPRELRRLLRLGRLLVADAAPVAFKLGVLTLVRDRLRAESLLDAQPAARLLRVRSDMERSHPLVTGVCRARGVKHVGYACGSYPQPTFRYAHLHFDEYGLLGEGFRSLFPEWPAETRYEVVGPLAVELDEARRGLGLPAGKPVIAAFPTSYDERFFMQRPFYEAFLRACVEAARRSGACLVVKEKDRTRDHVPFIAALCGNDVPFKVFYNEDVDGYEGRRTPELLAACSAAVVMGSSTVGWEALACGARTLVFEQEWARHPFESVEAGLVVHSPAELPERVSRLLSLDGQTYEAAAAPVIRRWAKRSNSRLVRDFIESLEHGS